MQITDLLLRYVWISILFAKGSGGPYQTRVGGEAQDPAGPRQLMQEPHCRAGVGPPAAPQLYLGGAAPSRGICPGAEVCTASLSLFTRREGHFQ